MTTEETDYVTAEETTEETDYVTAEEYNRVSADYWRVVRESEGFDLEAIVIPPYMSGSITGLIPKYCENGRYRGLVKYYGKVGLHRYNMLMETNYELASLIKFNSTQNCVCSYYITLRAHDPAERSSDKTFQVRIDEKSYARMNFVCSVARVKDTKDEATSKEAFVPHFHGGPKAKIPFKGELPHWPSDADLSDVKRFYMVTKAEWEMTDWIYMYMELVICAHDRILAARDKDFHSKLKIVNVVIETMPEDAEKERLKAKVAHVYITFTGLAEPQAVRQSFKYGEHVERRAIVRRVICEKTGKMKLRGTLCGDKNTGKQHSMTLRSSKKARWH